VFFVPSDHQIGKRPSGCAVPGIVKQLHRAAHILDDFLRRVNAENIYEHWSFMQKSGCPATIPLQYKEFQFLVFMDTIENKIGEWSSKGESSLMIARRIYFLSPTVAFEKEPDRELQVYQDVSNFFAIPFNSIQIVGSAKTGISLINSTPFSAESSDIDIAVVDQSLFMRYVEIAFAISEGYMRTELFPIKEGKPTRHSFMKYLAKGMFRPDLMPHCPERADWTSFFDRLSSNHRGFCSGMSAAIYASSVFFEWKQKLAIDKYIAARSLK